MERDFKFGYRHHPYLMPFNPSLSHFPTEICHLNPEPGYVNPHPFQHSNSNGPNDSQNWHYHMPHLDNLLPLPCNLDRQKIPVTGPTPPPKRFLIFDQSGGNTTLFYTCPPFQFQPSLAPNHLTTARFNAEDSPRDLKEVGTHENTEEIDALLCSDDDFSDDDMASTGHSPSDVTGEGPRDPPSEEMCQRADEGFLGPTAKRRRIVGPMLEEDEAESACDGPRIGSRREKVQWALEALRSMVPGARGKDGMAVVDEAIDYLRSLKVEMKAMGIDAL